MTKRESKIQVEQAEGPQAESEESIMTEADTITEAEAAEIVESDEESTETEEIAEPAPNLDDLPEGKKVLALGIKAMAEAAQTDYLRVYAILNAQGDPEKLLAAARESSEDENVIAKVTEARELQERVAAILAEADEILRETNAVDVLSDEDLAAKREELDGFKQTFLDSVNYGDEHVVDGFGRLFEDLPGMRKRRAKSAGGSDYTMTTSIKPKVAEITVDGTDVKNDKGNATFTYLSQYLKKMSGTAVPVGDLHKAWLAAAGTDNVEEVKDDVFFTFPIGEKSYQVKIVPKEAA